VVLRSIDKVVAFIRKEVLTSLSYRYSFLSGIFFGFIALLFYFAMADVFKSAIVADVIPYGGDYVAFIITGAILWQIVTLGLYSISGSFMLEMITGTLETIYLSRTNILLVLVGVSLFSLLTSLVTVVGSLVLAVIIFGVQVHFGNLLLAFLVLVLTYLSMLGFGMIFAGITIITKTIGQLVSVFTLLLMFLSGVVFPISLLPGVMQEASAFIPLTHALDALRSTLLLGAGLEEIAPSLASLIILSVVLIPIGYKTFFFCLNIAKKQGSLGQF
jgi:ABC-2 type transport system permease protein